MSIFTRIILVIGTGFTLYYIVNRYRKGNFKVSHTIFWTLFALFLFVTSIFPGYLTNLARLVGMMSSTNLVFLIIIFVLLVKVFLLSLAFEEQNKKIEEIVLKSAQKKVESEQNEQYDKK